MNRRNDFVGVCLALLLAVSPGCSDSDDGGSGMTASQSQCVSFTAAQDPASSEVSARDGVDSTCDTASVEFVITDVNGIYGAAWTIDYDETVVRFVALLTDNSFLGSDGVPLISLAQDASGRITLSISRDGTQSTDAVDFVGTEILGTLAVGPVCGR